MAIDVELYRRTIYTPADGKANRIHGQLHRSLPQQQILRRISVIDIHPEGATCTLLFVHGFGGSALQWIHQLRFFGQTMRVIAPDLRGHGLSDDPFASGQGEEKELAYTMDGLVDDLELVVDALEVHPSVDSVVEQGQKRKNRQPFYLIAHSFGGAIATEYVLRHHGLPSEKEDQGQERPRHDAPDGLVLIGVPTRFIVHAWILRAMNIPDPVFSRVAQWLKVALYAPQRTLKHMHDRIMFPWRGSERLPLLRVPTLVILGHRDTVFLREHYESVPRSIPNAQQVVISVSAHLVQLERPDAVNRAIGRFILSVGKGSWTSVPAATVEIQSQEPIQQDIQLEKQQTTDGNEGALALALARRDPRGRPALATRLTEMPWLQHYDSDVPETVSYSKQLLHEMLSNAAHVFPNRPAIIFFRQKISYRELELVSNRFAHALRTLGVKVGDRVAIVLPNIPQCVIAFYGTLKAGAVVVLGSPLSKEEEIAYQLRDSGAHILLTLASYRLMAERICSDTSVKHIIYTDVREYLPFRQRILIASLIEGAVAQGTPAPARGVGEIIFEGAPENPHFGGVLQHAFQHLLRSQHTNPLASGTTSSSLALLQYTSGTTDAPKGVMLSHGNLMVNVVQKRHWVPDAMRGREVILCVLPLSHSYGITSCMNMSMGLAATLVLLPTRRTDQILEAIKQHHPSIFPGVPALYLAIANYPKVRSYGVSSIKICISGSAPLPVEVQEAFEKLTRGHLVEGYGLTEASPVTHSNPLKGERRIGSIGLPLPGTNARIVDIKTAETLPAGEIGELIIQGPQVMQGYWHMPEDSTQVLKNGWLHTGDLARMDEDGFFTIVDRKKDLILLGSYNVYPRDVEEVLYEHPKVLEAAVVSTPSPSQGNGANSPFIKAVVVLKRGEQATADELLALCRERLDSYKVPKQIEFRTELPKNFVGKVLRRLLIEM